MKKILLVLIVLISAVNFNHFQDYKTENVNLEDFENKNVNVLEKNTKLLQDEQTFLRGESVKVLVNAKLEFLRSEYRVVSQDVVYNIYERKLLIPIFQQSNLTIFTPSDWSLSRTFPTIFFTDISYNSDINAWLVNNTEAISYTIWFIQTLSSTFLTLDSILSNSFEEPGANRNTTIVYEGIFSERLTTTGFINYTQSDFTFGYYNLTFAVYVESAPTNFTVEYYNKQSGWVTSQIVNLSIIDHWQYYLISINPSGKEATTENVVRFNYDGSGVLFLDFITIYESNILITPQVEDSVSFQATVKLFGPRGSAVFADIPVSSFLLTRFNQTLLRAFDSVASDENGLVDIIYSDNNIDPYLSLTSLLQIQEYEFKITIGSNSIRAFFTPFLWNYKQDFAIHEKSSTYGRDGWDWSDGGIEGASFVGVASVREVNGSLEITCQSAPSSCQVRFTGLSINATEYRYIVARVRSNDTLNHQGRIGDIFGTFSTTSSVHCGTGLVDCEDWNLYYYDMMQETVTNWDSPPGETHAGFSFTWMGNLANAVWYLDFIRLMRKQDLSSSAFSFNIPDGLGTITSQASDVFYDVLFDDVSQGLQGTGVSFDLIAGTDVQVLGNPVTANNSVPVRHLIFSDLKQAICRCGNPTTQTFIEDVSGISGSYTFSTIFTVDVESFLLTDLGASIFVKSSLDYNYFIFENNSLVAQGTGVVAGTAIFWTRNLIAGIIEVGIKFNTSFASFASRFFNTTYSNAGIGLGISIQHFAVTDTQTVLTFSSSKSGSFNVYENDSLSGTGSVQVGMQVISLSKVIIPDNIVLISYEFINGSDITFFNSSYSNPAMQKIILDIGVPFLFDNLLQISVTSNYPDALFDIDDPLLSGIEANNVLEGVYSWNAVDVLGTRNISVTGKIDLNADSDFDDLGENSTRFVSFNVFEDDLIIQYTNFDIDNDQIIRFDFRSNYRGFSRTFFRVRSHNLSFFTAFLSEDENDGSYSFDIVDALLAAGQRYHFRVEIRANITDEIPGYQYTNLTYLYVPQSNAKAILAPSEDPPIIINIPEVVTEPIDLEPIKEQGQQTNFMLTIVVIGGAIFLAVYVVRISKKADQNIQDKIVIPTEKGITRGISNFEKRISGGGQKRPKPRRSTRP